MTSFLAQLGKNVADRWLTLLVLPGLLWIAAGAGAYHLGQAHPLELKSLTSWLDHITTPAASQRNATIALTAASILLGAATIGLAAGGLGTLLQRLWGDPGDYPPFPWILQVRQRRWQVIREIARREIRRANDPALSDRARAKAQTAARRAQRRRLAHLQPPQRASRISERFHLTADRADTMYGLNLGLAWPRLWTVLPEGLRADITSARDAYTAAARLGGWAILYGALTVFWWPAFLLGAAILAYAIVKARAGANTLADLIDTAVDLHMTDLADKLHAPCTMPPTPDDGRAINQRLAVSRLPHLASDMAVAIFLSESHGNERVEQAVEKWIQTAGLVVTERSDPESGSWFRALKASARKGIGSPAVREAALTMAHGVEAHAVTAKDAEITELLLRSVGPVLVALEPYQDAIIQAGALLIVKADGLPTIIQLTAAQQLHLNHHPHLLRDPRTAIEGLSKQLHSTQED